MYANCDLFNDVNNPPQTDYPVHTFDAAFRIARFALS